MIYQSQRRCTAIKALLLWSLMCTGMLAHAGQVVGVVLHLNGPILATKADGAHRILAANSTVEEGDTLATQGNVYAQIKFSDDSQIILQPDTTLTIDAFSYEADKPQADKAAFTLIEGGVRVNAGQLGKRSRARVTLTTPAATIDMQGASAIVQYHAPLAVSQADQEAYLLASTATLDLDASLMDTMSDAPAVTAIRPLRLAQITPPQIMPPPAPTAGRAPGLYVQVIDGLIAVSNTGGAQNFAAGQFGFTPNLQQPPVLVPANPAIQFTPPPVFSQPATGGSSGSASKPGSVDCVVR